MRKFARVKRGACSRKNKKKREKERGVGEEEEIEIKEGGKGERIGTEERKRLK